jgi:NAD(P)-dependent dehydrogenase (short-subunit alcohol dehydrogenase family)
MRLAGKCGIVVGGGGAIGRVIALKLAGEGAAVAVVDFIQETADAVAQEIIAKGGNALAYAVDIRQFEAVGEMTESVASRLGSVDILVNSAGGSARKQMKHFKDQSVDVIDWMLGVNLHGPLYCIRAALGHMVENNYGKIINIASVVATGGWKACVEYGAAKGGIIAATRSLAMELGEFNINVNCVSPGLVQRPGDMPADELAFARRTSFLNRICTQDDIANLALYLALPESDYITGQNYIVDGGRSLGLKDIY